MMLNFYFLGFYARNWTILITFRVPDFQKDFLNEKSDKTKTLNLKTNKYFIGSLWVILIETLLLDKVGISIKLFAILKVHVYNIIL